MDQKQNEVNETNLIQLEEKRKEFMRRRRSEVAVAEGRITANWVDGDGTSITRIRLGGAGADLFRKLIAAGKGGVPASNVTLAALDQLKFAGVMARRIGGPFGFLVLTYPVEHYVLEEGTLAA